MLAFENAPPFAAPLRFFLTAPLFAVLAGLLLAFEGPDLLASRWTPGLLAATHLMTIGFMLQVMLGALIQILPVVAGASLKNSLVVARLVHVGLSVGALLLGAGFLAASPVLLGCAAAILGFTVLYFLAVTARALIGVPTTSPTIRGIKLALFGLAVVVGYGVFLALALAGGWSLPLMALADLHAGWGLGGWAGVLLAAMAYVVVPMFQLTPGYPARASWWFPIFVLAMLGLWSLALVAEWPWLVRLAPLGMALAGIAFAGLTLRLQGKRRRARPDTTYRYWQLGLIGSTVGLVLLSLAALWPAAADLDGWTVISGILLVAGGFVPCITGMLYKIIPFLSWMHLQSFGQAKVPAPAMNRILAEVGMHRQMLAYVAALTLLLAATIFPAWLARVAGLAFAVANGWLWWNLIGAVRRYRGHLADMAHKLATP
ncbi:hypothetical protein [Dechloromonas sp. HYN0024]|uniref:hypothetical protein n=1 Tax=Dechloromonas sp. HYN0024 TaxID=2231055 RepID=UPI001F072AD3|nr:hypothetical protein [Dechloromonas sp. HYN0024]